MLEEETGELVERRLEHAHGEPLAFYTSLQGKVRVGVEATGYTRWFERLLTELGHELWIGDAAQIGASVNIREMVAESGRQDRVALIPLRVELHSHKRELSSRSSESAIRDATRDISADREHPGSPKERRELDGLRVVGFAR